MTAGAECTKDYCWGPEHRCVRGGGACRCISCSDFEGISRFGPFCVCLVHRLMRATCGLWPVSVCAWCPESGRKFQKQNQRRLVQSQPKCPSKSPRVHPPLSLCFFFAAPSAPHTAPHSLAARPFASVSDLWPVALPHAKSKVLLRLRCL